MVPIHYTLTSQDIFLYLERIGFNCNGKLPRPDLETLEMILDGHLKTIPFGGLSLNYYTRMKNSIKPTVNKLDPNSTRGFSVAPREVFKKLVVQKREGCCFEHNSLLQSVLTLMGFDCTSSSARIIDHLLFVITGEERIYEMSHWMIYVTLGNRLYIVDAGNFHYSTPRPIPVDVNAEPTECEGNTRYRVVDGPKGSHPSMAKNYRLEIQYGETKWQPVYMFNLIPCYQVDLEAQSFYYICSPDKIFRHHLMLSKFIQDGYISLVDNKLTTRVNGTKVKVIDVNTESERRKVFRDVFDINIPEEYTEDLPISFGKLKKK